MKCPKRVMLLATFIGSIASGSEPLVVRAENWFASQYQESKAFEFDLSFYAEVEEFFPVYDSVEDLEKQAREFGDQAPSTLIQRLQAAKNGGQSHVYRIWYVRDDLWRTTRDDIPSNSDSPYGDSARSGDVLWFMTKNTLHATDTKAIKNQGEWVDPNTQRVSIMFSLFRSLFAASPPPIRYTISDAELAAHGDYDVVITTEHSNTNVDHARFYLNQADAGFEIRELGIERNDKEASAYVSKTTYDDWRYDSSVFQRPLAHERTLYNGERVRTVYRIKELRAITDNDAVDDLAALPSVNGVDPIRGPVTFTTVMNHSENEELLLARASGTGPDSQSPIEILSSNRIGSESDSDTIDRLGLLTLFGLGLLFVGIYINKRSSS